MRRNQRAGVEDRWYRKSRSEDGSTALLPTKLHGKGSRWRARYVDSGGREHARSFGRKAEAQQWLNKQISDQVTGDWVNPALSSVTFGALAERWISTKAMRAPKTVAGYRSILDTIVLPKWGVTPLREIEFGGLQVWITSLSMTGSTRFDGKGLSASRVRQTHQLMGAVLKFAVRSKHLPANPADGIELPRLPEAEQKYLNHEQLHRLAVASGRFRTLILVLGYCGLRFGEAAALTVADIDLDARRIRVHRSVTNVAKIGLVEGPTKNHGSRAVPVPDFVVALLRTEVSGRAKDDLVFPSRRGGHLRLGEARWLFDRGAASVDGCAGLRLHDLRHTCASLAIRSGANVKVVQRLLGHKTAVLTLDRYGHLFPDDLDAVAKAFDDAADAMRTIEAN